MSVENRAPRIFLERSIDYPLFQSFEHTFQQALENHWRLFLNALKNSIDHESLSCSSDSKDQNRLSIGLYLFVVLCDTTEDSPIVL
jgi:hypothetical protein